MPDVTQATELTGDDLRNAIFGAALSGDNTHYRGAILEIIKIITRNNLVLEVDTAFPTLANTFTAAYSFSSVIKLLPDPGLVFKMKTVMI